jgi:hypothetical protein
MPGNEQHAACSALLIHDVDLSMIHHETQEQPRSAAKVFVQLFEKLLLFRSAFL